MIKLPEPGVYPFWFWNGEQSEEEITRQLKFFHNNGCRGAAIHSRVGNRIPYLSERWFELVRHSCREAERLGLKIWLYDEDGFPSGNAGGRVQRERPDLVQHALRCFYGDARPGLYAAFDPVTFRRLPAEAAVAGALCFEIHREPRHVDTLNPEAAHRFLTITHAEYDRYLSEWFGQVIEAVYTDDESFLVHFCDGYVWSPLLETAYRERTGRDLRDDLPALAENLPESAEVRLNYFRIAQDLFLKNFIRPQIDWCHSRGVSYLGHLCGDEGPLVNSVRCYGSPMPYMRAEDIPSIDDYLCDRADQRYLAFPFCGRADRKCDVGDRLTHPLLTYKTASSVANQFAGGLCSAETLTFLQWRVSPGFLERQMRFELGMGVNLMTHHAYYYTLGRGTLRDCPPSYGFQQPFAAVFGAANRRWTRIAEILASGVSYRDTLVLYPAGIFRSAAGSDIVDNFKNILPRRPEMPDFDRIQEVLAVALLKLMRRHVGFDLGDETLLLEEGKVGDGVLQLGAGTYTNVVVPGLVAPLPETARMLAEFQRCGGRIWCDENLDEIPAAMELSGTGTDEILVEVRQTPGGKLVYMLNLSGSDLSPRLKLEQEFQLYDPVADRVVFRGRELPADFVLRDGAVALLMPADFSASRGEWRDSSFCRMSRSRFLEPSTVRTMAGNLALLPENGEITLPAGVEITALYAENDSPVEVNGIRLEVSEEAHPCDPCFRRIDVSGVVRPGLNRVVIAERPERIYLEGNFLVDDAGGLRAVPEPSPWQLGDLSRQGLPYYWGKVVYRCEFSGPAALLEVKMAGAAIIRLNGRECGSLLGGGVVTIAEYCHPEENQLEIELFNSAQNMVCAGAEPPAPFGIESLRLLDNRH